MWIKFSFSLTHGFHLVHRPLHDRSPPLSINLFRYRLAMSGTETENSPIDDHSAQSSPLSSVPSIYLSLPSPASSVAARPRPSSAPLPRVMESHTVVERGVADPMSRIGDLPSVQNVRASVQGSRTISHPSYKSLGLDFQQRKPSLDSRNANNGLKQLEKVSVNDRESPSIGATSHHRPLLAFFSSDSANLNPWPSSPLAGKINKSGYSETLLGKRKASLLDENDAIGVGPLQQKVAAKALVDRSGHQNSSPDYKAMLNLSDTPSHHTDSDPFTQAHHLDPMNSYHISTSRDPSLSPTVKNPSLGSLDSEEISAVCLAPTGESRSPSSGLFACSGYLGDGPADMPTEGSNRHELQEIEKRRVAEVMQRWAESGIPVSDSSFELYKSLPPATDPVRQRPMIALAPPRPVDRLSLEQHSRALDSRQQYGPSSGIEASTGLLDAVCEAEAAVLQRSIGMGWSLSSLAPADMHLRPVLNATPLGSSTGVVAAEALSQPYPTEVGNDIRTSAESESVADRQSAQNPEHSRL